jgi:DNA-binding CsgD family transcriptional regulator
MKVRSSFKSYQPVILYGISLALLIMVLRWLEIRLLLFTHSFEIYAGAIALFFTLLGIWLALKLTKPKIETRIVEKPLGEFIFNQKACDEFGLSKREIEVLQLVANGLSNQEIADQLFVSLHTVKTHISRLFEKLKVKRRTQAIEHAKRFSLIA